MAEFSGNLVPGNLVDLGPISKLVESLATFPRTRTRILLLDVLGDWRWI